MALYIFGGDTGETPDTLRKKRALVEALWAGRAPRNVGEGIAAIGDALAGKIIDWRADRAERAGRASAGGAMSEIGAALNRGGGAFPPAPSDPGATASAPASSAATNPNVGSTIDFARAEQGAAPKFSGSQEEFVAMLMPAAIEASKRTGIDPRIIVAQAAQETGWGRSAPGNNYFGIKSHGKGGGQTFTTHEVINGKRVKINDSFRQFGSPADSVAGYADFMLENPRYGEMRSAQGLDAQLAALGASGYATDPNYASSVGSIARGIPMPDIGPAQPVQVASLDPSIGVPQVNPGVAAAAQEQGIPADNPGLAALSALQAQEGQAPMPAAAQGGAPLPPSQLPVPATGFGQANVPMAPAGSAPAPVQPSPQVAQALQHPPQAQPMPEMAGNTGDLRNGVNMEMLVRAANNPWLSDSQSGIVQALMRQEMVKNDPVSQMEQEKMRLQIEQLRNPRQERPWWVRPDGTVDPAQIANQQAGRASTNVTVGGEPGDGALRKKLDEKTGEAWAGYSELGATSAAMSQDMQILDELIKVAPQGPVAGRLAEMFPGISSAGAAFQAVVKRVAPTLRAPGSGATSDIEYDGMLKSLPALSNRPEANSMIAGIIKSKAAINIERAEIIDAYGRGDITASDARSRIGELNKRSIMTPEMKQLLGGVETSGETGAPAVGEIVDGYRFKGGNPADESSWEKAQ